MNIPHLVADCIIISFDQERGLDHEEADAPLSGIRDADESLFFHERVDNAVQRLPQLRISEDQLRHCGTVDAPVLLQNSPAKKFHGLLIARPVSVKQAPAHFVEREDLRSPALIQVAQDF